jgi:predicted dehydrogenase
VFATAGQTPGDWRGSRATGGGVLLELASHHVDLARWLFDAEVAEAFARLRSHHAADDSATLELQMTTGLAVQTLAAYAAVEEDRLAVYGPQGKLQVDRYTGLDVEFTPPMARGGRLRRMAAALGRLRRLPYLREKRRAAGNEPSYHAALAAFAEAVSAGQPPQPDLNAGFRALAVIVAAEESARTGRPAAPAKLPE